LTSGSFAAWPEVVESGGGHRENRRFHEKGGVQGNG
jgi:hypothetical protein